MGIGILSILVIVSFIYNIVKKNRVKLNLCMILVPIILTSVSIFYNYHQTSTERETIMNVINLISSILALILAIIAILWVIKDRKNIKSTKSILLLGVVVSYICLLLLSQSTYEFMFTIYDYYRKLYITNISIGLLFILEINLFTNLISNNKKEEDNGK